MNIMFPVLLRYSDVGLLLLRLMVAVVFFSSGLSHLKDPVGRSKSIGASPAFTGFLGSAEVLGSIGVAFGILIQLAARYRRRSSCGKRAFGEREGTAGTTI